MQKMYPGETDAIAAKKCSLGLDDLGKVDKLQCYSKQSSPMTESESSSVCSRSWTESNTALQQEMLSQLPAAHSLYDCRTSVNSHKVMTLSSMLESCSCAENSGWEHVDVHLNKDKFQTVMEIFQAASAQLEEVVIASVRRAKPECFSNNYERKRQWDLSDKSYSFVGSTLRVYISPSANNNNIAKFRRHSMKSRIPAMDRIRKVIGKASGTLPNCKAKEIFSIGNVVREQVDSPSRPPSFYLSLPPLMTDLEITVLWESFDFVKKNATEIGQRTIERIRELVPGAYRGVIICEAADENTDQWQLAQLGCTLLSGIEKCLLRLKRPVHLHQCAKEMCDIHIHKYGVGADKMAASLTAFGTILLDFLQTKYTNHPCFRDDATKNGSIEEGEFCFCCSTWTKLIGLISLLLISTGSEVNLH